ncbi:CLUMA_CG003560, isoform A [Clunio marinus]|uniref:CLUMA_CG003560, isoform A n=1 Tax=Clunio marinus TaxID=568069 RepID=A0A1J1HPA1_9DIPT|nr:CLUMA_CG003560, isoform A [Clunio marinus]
MKLQHLDLPVTKFDANVCKALRENTQDTKLSFIDLPFNTVDDTENKNEDSLNNLLSIDNGNSLEFSGTKFEILEDVSLPENYYDVDGIVVDKEIEIHENIFEYISPPMKRKT